MDIDMHVLRVRTGTESNCTFADFVVVFRVRTKTRPFFSPKARWRRGVEGGGGGRERVVIGDWKRWL